jgi:hypothetical protein
MYIILLLVTHTQWDLFHKNEIIAQEIEFHNVFLSKGYILTRLMGRLFSHCWCS